MKKEVFLELINVSKKYPNLKAVDKLSMSVFKGDIYGFLGPNGAGKSTTIRMILSLISPDSGKIKLFGHDLSENRYKTLSRLGALIEKPDFYRFLSAQKNLEILARLSGVKNMDKKIDESLKLVNLHKRAESKVRTYSQGMRQRLGIAQTLLHDPELIILDEPGNGLDPQGQKEMRSLIQKLNRERGITILISSHILAEIEQVANRMIIINNGKKVVEGQVNKLLNGTEIKISMEVSDLEEAQKVLEKMEINDIKTIKEENKIFMSVSREIIPPVLDTLSRENIRVFSVVPMKTLEEYFISLTSNEHAG